MLLLMSSYRYSYHSHNRGHVHDLLTAAIIVVVAVDGDLSE